MQSRRELLTSAAAFGLAAAAPKIADAASPASGEAAKMSRYSTETGTPALASAKMGMMRKVT